MDSTEARQIKSNESDEKQSEKNKKNILVPVTITIAIPIEIDYDTSQLDVIDEYNGDGVVDISDHPDAVKLAIEAVSNTEEVFEALDSLINAAQFFKRKYPSIKAYYTPFGGLIPEQNI